MARDQDARRRQCARTFNALLRLAEDNETVVAGSEISFEVAQMRGNYTPDSVEDDLRPYIENGSVERLYLVGRYSGMPESDVVFRVVRRNGKPAKKSRRRL